MENQPSFLDRFFHLSENGTTVRTEILAGITTFMTMAYILAVNPTIMSAAGMDKGAVLTATALASFIGTLCMAFFANYPFALAPGMGLNAFFAFTVVLQMGYTWEMALAAVFFEGLIFIVLSLTNVREAIFNAIPITLKKAVSAGIGLFIALIGLLNAQIIVANPATRSPCSRSNSPLLRGPSTPSALRSSWPCSASSSRPSSWSRKSAATSSGASSSHGSWPSSAN